MNLIKNIKLKVLNGNMFKNTPKMEYLDISENAIETIPANFFDELTGLKSLLLDGNKIKAIGPETFRVLQRVLKHQSKFLNWPIKKSR